MQRRVIVRLASPLRLRVGGLREWVVARPVVSHRWFKGRYFEGDAMASHGRVRYDVRASFYLPGLSTIS